MVSVLFTALGLATTGCVAPLRAWTQEPWIADYDTAERCLDESDRELLIVYQDDRRGAAGPMDDVLKSKPVDDLTRRYVRCLLLRSYEPDRRYVAQYGVVRAPAVVVVHRDGTYHARTGAMSAAELAAFLADAQPPGAEPAINPYLPRTPRYRWHRSIEEAERASRQSGRPMLVVVYRSLSQDWRRLSKMLSRHEVYHRFADLVHCRLGVLGFAQRTHLERFGSVRLPAMIVARVDGTYEVLETPASYRAVVRFADAATRPAKSLSQKAGNGFPTRAPHPLETAATTIDGIGSKRPAAESTDAMGEPAASAAP